MSDVSLWLTIISSSIAILGTIGSWIKSLLEKNNSISKDKKQEIRDAIDDWYDEDELKTELINSYSMIGSTPRFTNQILSNFDMDNLYEENVLKKGFKKSRLKIDALISLIKNQLKGYGKPGDLSEKIKKEKDALIEQMGKDLDAIMENNYLGIMQMFKCSEKDLVLGKKAFSHIKEFGLKKINNLFDRIIGKICL